MEVTNNHKLSQKLVLAKIVKNTIYQALIQTIIPPDQHRQGDGPTHITLSGAAGHWGYRQLYVQVTGLGLRRGQRGSGGFKLGTVVYREAV